jgi:hypothetical protein
LPSFDAFTNVKAQERTYRVLPLELIVWVSVGVRGLRDLHPTRRGFPPFSTLASQTRFSFMKNPSVNLPVSNSCTSRL